MRRFWLPVIAGLFALPVMAQDFNRGMAAYKAGDYDTAMDEWIPLAEDGNAYAQFNLGILYDYQLGAYKDAVKWYGLSARKGLNAAQFNLGVMYDYGYGVSKDFVLAYLWFDLAAANGHKDGEKNRDVIAQKMSDEDISKARALAELCLSSNYEECGSE